MGDTNTSINIPENNQNDTGTDSTTEANSKQSETFDPSQTIDSLADEYFQTREDLRTLNLELKEAKEQHQEFEELQKLSEQLRQIRKRMKFDEEIALLDEKAGTMRERQKLLKEMIKIKLVKSGEEEIQRGKKKLKVTSVLKEMRIEDDIPEIASV